VRITPLLLRESNISTNLPGLIVSSWEIPGSEILRKRINGMYLVDHFFMTLCFFALNSLMNIL
jgi:hypothetical protein